MRSLCLLLAIALSACAPASDLDPADAYAQAQQAILDHDAETAHALLASAARHDHLPSLLLLMQAYDQGFVVDGEWDESEPVRLALDVGGIRTVTTGLRFARAINRGVRAQDPLALRLHAQSLAHDEDPERRQEAERIYRDLLDSDLPATDLYHLAMTVGSDDDRARLTRQAAAEGDPQACTFSVWFYEDEPQTTLSHVAGIARYLDRIGDCTPDRPIPTPALGPIRDLRAQLDLGNEDATVALDSLRELGVFERHPELSDIVGDHLVPAATS